MLELITFSDHAQHYNGAASHAYLRRARGRGISGTWCVKIHSYSFDGVRLDRRCLSSTGRIDSHQYCGEKL